MIAGLRCVHRCSALRVMETLRIAEPNEHDFVEDSWVRDQTQDGDVHKNPGPSDRPEQKKPRRGSIRIRAVNQVRIAGDIKGKCDGPTRRHHKPQGTPSHT